MHLKAPLALAGGHWRETETKSEVIRRVAELKDKHRIDEALRWLRVGERDIPINVARHQMTRGSDFYADGWRYKIFKGSRWSYYRVSRSDPESIVLTFFVVRPDEGSRSKDSYTLGVCRQSGHTSVVCRHRYPHETHLVSDLPPELLSDLPVFPRLGQLILSLDTFKHNEMLAVVLNRGPRTDDMPQGLLQEVTKRAGGRLQVFQSDDYNYPSESTTVSSILLNHDHIVVEGRFALPLEDGILQITDGDARIAPELVVALEAFLANSWPLPEAMVDALFQPETEAKLDVDDEEEYHDEHVLPSR